MILFLLKSFFDYFQTECETYNCLLNQIIITITQNFYIKNFKFFNLFSSTYDGAIFIDSNINILIELSIFLNCTSLNRGGGIYLQTLNCILDKVCGEKCFIKTSSIQGQFCFIKSSQRTETFYISVHHCPLDSLITRAYSFQLEYGRQIVRYLNSSNNFATAGSGMLNWYPETLEYSFNNFHKTNSSSHTLYLCHGKTNFNFTNILKNFAGGFICASTYSSTYIFFKLYFSIK